jgi:preprotein translocase subunit SecE
MNDYKQKDYAKAQQKIIMIILYSHLYDNIPDTNPRALQLVNYYFFKEPYIPSAEMEINADDTSNLSFVSLLLEKNNVGAIGDELINYDFYTGIEKDANIRKVRENVMRFFNNLNKELTAFTFQNKLHLFIWYIVIFFVITIIALFIYMRVVYKMSNGTFNKPMQELAGNITNGISSGLGIATAVVVPSAPDAPNKTEAKVDGWEPIVSPANTAPRPNYMESENTSTNDMTKEVDK